MLKNRDNSSAETVTKGNLNRKRKREGKAEDFEGILLDWFRNVILKKVPIICGIFCEKAEQFAQMMCVEIFSSINGRSTR